MDKNKLNDYARILVSKGAALKPGQLLYVDAEPAHEELAAAIAGAVSALHGRLEIGWASGMVERALLDADIFQKPHEDSLRHLEDIAGQGASYLRLTTPDLDMFAGISAEASSHRARISREVSSIFRKSGLTSTCTACVPGPAWAKLVFPELGAAEALERLWDAVFFCARVEEPDPLKAWDGYMERTRIRKELLNGRGYTAYHYKSAVTDLYLYPAEQERWSGGYMELPDGRRFIPNIPTEEVFLVPHRDKTEGVVCSTMPLNVDGSLIEGIQMRLEKGRITEASAKKGEELLLRLLDTDGGSRYLGEMALVDQRSPIAQTGNIYYTTLYDENASCHIAFGMGGAPFLPEAERRRRGLNTSVLHIDFMVGSDDLDVFGRREDGGWEPILKGGSWAEAFRC